MTIEKFFIVQLHRLNPVPEISAILRRKSEPWA
jgi:hypothetical protein